MAHPTVLRQGDVCTEREQAFLCSLRVNTADNKKANSIVAVSHCADFVTEASQ